MNVSRSTTVPPYFLAISTAIGFLRVLHCATTVFGTADTDIACSSPAVLAAGGAFGILVLIFEQLRLLAAMARYGLLPALPLFFVCRVLWN